MMLNLIKIKFLGGEAREFGGEASPLSPPPLDETLVPVYVVSEGSFRHCKLQSFLGEGVGTTCPRPPLLSRTLQIVDPVPFLYVHMPILSYLNLNFNLLLLG